MAYWILFVCNLSIGCLTQEFNVANDCEAAKRSVQSKQPIFTFQKRVEAYCQMFTR